MIKFLKTGKDCFFWDSETGYRSDKYDPQSNLELVVPMIGTTLYIKPEQIKIDYKRDIYFDYDGIHYVVDDGYCNVHHALLLQDPAVEVFASGYPGLYLCARFGHALLVDHDPNALRLHAALEKALSRLPARESAWLRGMAARLLAMAPIQTTNDAAEDHHEEA